MEYVANLTGVAADPAAWARRRESEGWHVLSAPDHFYTRRPYPHVWVSATALAMATSRATISTAFVNNLLRSPVEVAQAALMLQLVSGGRFELGLGAGWARAEILDAGLDYPERGDRAGAFIEATQIVRSLLHTGSCRFEGRYYRIEVENLGPVSKRPPPLVCSVGGPRTIREVTPHADRVEIVAASPAIRAGAVDLGAMAGIGDSYLLELIDRVRAVDPEIGLGMFVYCMVGDDTETRELAAHLEGSLHGRFCGPAGKVAEGLAWLEEIGITRAQITPFHDTGLDRLAPQILR